MAQMGPLSISESCQSSNSVICEVRWDRGRTGNKTLVEGLVGKVLIVLLEMLFRWADKFHGNKFVAASSISSLYLEKNH